MLLLSSPCISAISTDSIRRKFQRSKSSYQRLIGFLSSSYLTPNACFPDCSPLRGSPGKWSLRAERRRRSARRLHFPGAPYSFAARGMDGSCGKMHFAHFSTATIRRSSAGRACEREEVCTVANAQSAFATVHTSKASATGVRTPGQRE